MSAHDPHPFASGPIALTYVPVPVDRLDEVYAVLGGKRAVANGDVTEDEEFDAAGFWTEDRVAQALRRSGENIRKVVSVLARHAEQHPNEFMLVGDLAASVDMDVRGFRGVLSGLAKVCKSVSKEAGWPTNRKYTWFIDLGEYDRGQGWYYRIDLDRLPAVKGALRRVGNG